MWLMRADLFLFGYRRYSSVTKVLFVTATVTTEDARLCFTRYIRKVSLEILF